jgi:hypothetical protein
LVCFVFFHCWVIVVWLLYDCFFPFFCFSVVFLVLRLLFFTAMSLRCVSMLFFIVVFHFLDSFVCFVGFYCWTILVGLL